jgi:thiosulfate/3-mercaptopyruvate sulfurtransferase
LNHAELPPFVAADWVEDRLEHLVLADVRWSLDGTQNHDTYLEGHLPGAVFVDLETVLSDPPSAQAGRHPLPSPEHFAEALGALGIGHDAIVIAYDQGPGAIAARLVWMLRIVGQPAAVLDGGLLGWEGPLESGEVQRLPAERSPLVWPEERLADADLVDELRRGPRGTIVDARDPVRFRGEAEPVDPRAGHIPGAVNLPATGNVTERGRLRDLDDLRDRYGDAGTLRADEVVTYCGSGVTATHDLLVLELLGVQGRLYPGSWSAWSADEDRPIATGP